MDTRALLAARMTSSFLTSTSARVGGGVGASPLRTGGMGMGVTLRRLGESFAEVTPPRVSPTMSTGAAALKAMCVHLFFLPGATYRVGGK